jgi:large subunit ribosomal protein L25
MKTFEIIGEKREAVGKKDAKKIRKDGKIPCVLYGGAEIKHFVAPINSFKKAIYTPSVYIVGLNINGVESKAVLQDIQFHPVSDAIQHIDFLEINDNEPVTISIPIRLEGLAAGVKAGGKLQQMQRRLKVKGLPQFLPDYLNIDVTEVGLGGTVKVGKLHFENLELLDDKNVVVAAVKLTRAARGLQQEEPKK